ncbi:MAG: polysaccharide deacetylase family protein [Chloroflexi bacterium]|nr:polysaccharide deacetylase family protein [Chloroflexota bacterium]
MAKAWRRWLLALLVIAVGWVFFVSSAGIVSTNDGSHFALTRSIVDYHSTAIDHYIDYTARQDLGSIPPPDAYLDLSYYGGHFYSDRAPGTAFLAVPFYLAGDALMLLGIIGQSGLESSVSVLSAIAGAFAILGMYGIGRELGVRAPSALVAALLVGLGTLLWKYSTLFYNHALSAALVTGAAYLAIRWAGSRRLSRFPALLFCSGLLLGYAVLVDYINVLLFIPFGLYILLQRAKLQHWETAIAGALPALATLVAYNWLNFGSPLATSYTYQYHFEWARALSTTYTTPIVEGLRFFLFGQNGIFAVSPILLLSLAGLAIVARRKWRELSLILIGFLILLGVLSMHRTYSGGGSEDTRYILSIIPLLGAGLGVIFERVLSVRSRYWRVAAWGAIAPVAGFSIVRSYLSLQAMFGHPASEQQWLKALGTVLNSHSLDTFAPRLLDTGIYLLLACGAGAAVLVMIGLTRVYSKAAWQIHPLRAAVPAVCLIAVIGALSWYYTAEASGNYAARESALLDAGCNLLSNASFESTDSSGPASGWKLTGTAHIASNGRNSKSSAEMGPGAGAVESALVYVGSGQQHQLTWYATGNGAYWVDFIWENDLRQPVGTNSSFQRAGSLWGMNSLGFIAPLDATGLRVRFRSADGTAFVDDVRLSQAGVRVEPIRDFGKAALAFTFDWETAMGGAIHSRGAAEPSVSGATEHGLKMRQGAENLLTIFQKYGVQGTFYSTGYDLLYGNTEHQQFAGDPTYKWASQKNGWASNYWAEHPWYSFDPYGTYQTDPGWYFGDLVDKMIAAGQDIESHTFGHLYARGTSLKEFKTDLDQWNSVASEHGLGPAKTFAFPWAASNSLTLPHYQALADRGVLAVTRLYQYGDPFELSGIASNPPLLVYPDQELQDTADSEKTALQSIDEVLARRGFTSLWTHPESVADSNGMQMWDRVVAYAASKREDGLVVDTLTNIVEHYLAVRNLKVESTQNGNDLSITLQNTGKDGITGTTLTLPGIVASAAAANGERLEIQKDQIVIPALESGAKIKITAHLEY